MSGQMFDARKRTQSIERSPQSSPQHVVSTKLSNCNEFEYATENDFVYDISEKRAGRSADGGRRKSRFEEGH